MTKKCCKCKQEKPLDEFSNNKGRKDGKNSMCKPCMKLYDKKRFKNMDRQERDLRNKRRKDRSKKDAEKIYNILVKEACVDCGENDPLVLEFDHQRDKDFNISNMIGDYKWSRILSEIEKCEIRCANCHRIKTAKERGYYRLFLKKREVAQW
jgi:hypothetical protein